MADTSRIKQELRARNPAGKARLLPDPLRGKRPTETESRSLISDGCQYFMFARSSVIPGPVGSNPSVSRVQSLKAGISKVAKRPKNPAVFYSLFRLNRNGQHMQSLTMVSAILLGDTPFSAPRDTKSGSSLQTRESSDQSPQSPSQTSLLLIRCTWCSPL